VVIADTQQLGGVPTTNVSRCMMSMLPLLATVVEAFAATALEALIAIHASRVDWLVTLANCKPATEGWIATVAEPSVELILVPPPRG
jgi:hypothetical protein